MSLGGLTEITFVECLLSMEAERLEAPGPVGRLFGYLVVVWVYATRKWPFLQGIWNAKLVRRHAWYGAGGVSGLWQIGRAHV